MKKMALAPLLSLIPISAFSAEYIVPPEYDNTVNSVKSHNEVLITNLTALLSTNTYFIGSKTLNYKCVEVPKINCRGGATPNIKLSLKGVPVLKEPMGSQSLSVYEVDTQSEDDGGASFRVCGGALGVVSWDNSEMTQDATTKEITYSYTPINHVLDYYFFTNIAGSVSANGIDGGQQRGDDNSYIVINADQVCNL